MISTEKNGTGSSTGSSSSSSSFEEEKEERMSTSSGEGSNKGAPSIAGSSVSSSSSSSFSSNKKDVKKKPKTTKKDRRDPQRFMGDGVIFKGKLIGVRDVAQPRGETMAREALQELKLQKKTSGEHKQKVTVSIALDGLQIKDDKTKALLYLHPVHKISFISQDASDSRAFGYIYGSPENEHTFFAIKTEKAAQQIVMCMRDLFQIAYELKKDEIVMYRRQQFLAKQTTPESFASNDESKSPIGSSGVTNEAEGKVLPSDMSNSASDVLLDLSSIEVPKEMKDMLGPIDDGTKTGSDAFFSDPWGYLRSMSVEDQFGVQSNGVSVDHVDPFDLDAHQQASPMGLPRSLGLIAIGNPSPFGLARHAPFQPSNDPFNTSFVNVPSVPYVQTLSLSVPSTIQGDSAAEDAKMAVDTGLTSPSSEDRYAALTEISETEHETPLAGTAADISSINETVSSMRISESSSDSGSSCLSESSVQFSHSVGSFPPLPPPPPTSIFSDLDPLGKDRPYVDKKDFFYDLKNPPKKVLKDLIAENGFSTTLEFADIAPSPSPSSSEDDLSPPLPPPPAPCAATSLPPPLPPPFNQNHYRRRTSTISPTSSLEDATMASCSSSSSSSSATSSPIGEIFLPPPPPPPRPATMLPSVCPPPVPRRQASQISSPPIPIPSRRTEATNANNVSSISSSSWDSNCNGGQWATSTTIHQSTINGHLSTSFNNNKAGSRNVRNSAGNPFGVDVFLSPAMPATSGSLTNRPSEKVHEPMMQANIFQKEADPFADDDFFATLHSGKINNKDRSRDFKWAGDNQ